MTKNLLLVMVLASCGGGDGEAPTVSNLAIGPLSVTAGQATVITGSIRYTDPDGDVEKIGAAVTFGDLRTEVGPERVQPATDGATEGSVAVAMSLTPPVAGMYALEVWLLDEAGNKSNKLTVTVTAQ